jgi:hypothetical protein
MLYLLFPFHLSVCLSFDLKNWVVGYASMHQNIDILDINLKIYSPKFVGPLDRTITPFTMEVRCEATKIRRMTLLIILTRVLP